ncbi:cytochrome P450 [Actinomycetes bacterium KLBMP 9759]
MTPASQITREQLADDPHPALAALRASEPVAWLPALGAWLVTSRDLALRVLRDPATFTVDDPRFSTAQVVGPSMLSLDGPAHTRVRKPFVGPFRPADVAARFTGPITEHAEALVAGFRTAGRAELRGAFAGPLAVQVVADVLGMHGVEPTTLLRWYGTFVAAVSEVTAGGDVPPEAADAFAALAERVHAGIDGRSLLADAVAGGLGTDETVSNAAILLFGGIETTEGMIVNLLRHLLARPDLLAAVRADPGLLTAAVEESLRLEPAAAVVDRYATADVELAGASIRRGDPVTVSIAGANRDPATFPDPDTFDLRRPNARQHLAFAHGPHFCPAMDLARLETAIGTRTLLTELPGLAAADVPTPAGLVFRKPPTLDATWTP